MIKNLIDYATEEEKEVIERQKSTTYRINASYWSTEDLGWYLKEINNAKSIKDIEEIKEFRMVRDKQERLKDIEDLKNTINRMQEALQDLENQERDSSVVDEVINRVCEERKNEIKNIEYEKFIQISKYSHWSGGVDIYVTMWRVEKGNPYNSEKLYDIDRLSYKERGLLGDILENEGIKKIRDRDNLLNKKLREKYELIA